MLFILLKIKSRLFCIFPRRLSLFLGRILGGFLYFAVPLRKKVALINLKTAFPEKNDTEIKRILKRCYMHFGMLISEFLRLPKLNKKNIHKNINLDLNTKKLLNENKPSIIMTGHFGNWEIFLPMLGYNGYNVSGVAQIQKNKNGQQFFNWLRECDNTTIIQKKDSIKSINETLNKGNHLILVSDQYAGSKGTINHFFKIPTSTPKGAAIFNSKKNIPIILIFIFMNSNYSYSIYSKLLIVPSKEQSKDDHIISINQAYNDELEKIIIKYPEQYFWFHKRWNRKIYK